MMRRVRVGVALAVLVSLAVSGCGGDGDEQASESKTAAEPTTTTDVRTSKGAPISEPLCEFVGVSDDDATEILGFPVTSKSEVGSSDPSGGSCRFTPQATSSDAFEVVVSVFPDTKDTFTSYTNRFTEAKNERTGNRLWTPPVEVPDLGDAAYSFGSPDGGYDNVWVFANGYRVLVIDQNRTDVPGAAEKVRALAQQAASNI
jgi:hypothetical protein